MGAALGAVRVLDDPSSACFDDVDAPIGARQYHEGDGGYDNEKGEGCIPDLIANPILLSVYPKLMQNVIEYGHPNIPFGTRDRQICRTLRCLQFQDRLGPAETDRTMRLSSIPLHLLIEARYRFLGNFYKPSFPTEEKPPITSTAQHTFFDQRTRKTTFIPPSGPVTCLGALSSAGF